MAKGIAIVYQEMNLAGHLSVAENLFLGKLPTRGRGLVDWRRIYRQAQEILDRLQIDLPLRELVNNLTISQQQMTEIAKALSHRVKVLVLDEPTSALSQSEVQDLFRVVRDLKKQGVAIIYISHALEEILTLCDRVTVLRDGELIGELSVAEASTEQLIRMMVGRPLTEMFPKVSAPVGDELLRVENLQVQGKQSAVSFSVRAGEVLAFSGLLGAGRTALMQAIFGAIPVTAGTVFRRGNPVKIRSPQEAVRHGIGYLSDDRRRSGLVTLLGVSSNLTLASLPQFSRLGVLKTREEHGHQLAHRHPVFGTEG